MIVIFKYRKAARMINPSVVMLSLGSASAFAKGSLSLTSILTTFLQSGAVLNVLPYCRDITILIQS